MADKSQNVTNTTDTALGLPSGEVVPAKSTIAVKDWSKSENNDVVKSWLNAGALELGGEIQKAEGEGDAPEARVAGTEQDETGNVSPEIRQANTLTGEGGRPVGTTEEATESGRSKKSRKE